MTINNLEEFLKNLWDWAILDGCFGDTKIHPTDVDGMVERRGKVLFIETKAEGVAVPDAQAWAFEALRRTQIVTVFFVWGKKNSPEWMTIWTRHEKHEPFSCDLGRLRKETARWYQWADSIY